MLPADVKLPCEALGIQEADKLFFSESPKRIAQAVALCNTCPIKDKCLDFAIENNCEFGIFGGTTPQERKAMV
jgi:hypothetical protein